MKTLECFIQSRNSKIHHVSVRLRNERKEISSGLLHVCFVTFSLFLCVYLYFVGHASQLVAASLHKSLFYTAIDVSRCEIDIYILRKCRKVTERF